MDNKLKLDRGEEKLINQFWDFFFFLIFTYLSVFLFFLSPSYKFWLIFKHFLTKNLLFLQDLIFENIEIRHFKVNLSKSPFPEKSISALYTNGHILDIGRSMNLILHLKL